VFARTTFVKDCEANESRLQAFMTPCSKRAVRYAQTVVGLRQSLEWVRTNGKVARLVATKKIKSHCPRLLELCRRSDNYEHLFLYIKMTD
ncbi:hypothetical protein LissoIVSPER_00006, partial [Lissonota sp. PSUC_FEM 10030012]|nr:hypothetical protein [Lissonota sp. PSUC_FEM 10030012]